MSVATAAPDVRAALRRDVRITVRTVATVIQARRHAVPAVARL